MSENEQIPESLCLFRIAWLFWAGIVQGRAPTLMTRHVREATRNRQARLVGRLPIPGSCSGNVVLSLPTAFPVHRLRNRPHPTYGLKNEPGGSRSCQRKTIICSRTCEIGTEQTFGPDGTERAAYSYRNASIGFSFEAFTAGKNPETIPTRARIANEMIITPIDACRKIAPSWSVVL